MKRLTSYNYAANSVACNPTSGAKHSCSRTPEVTDPFYVEKQTCDRDNKEAKAYVDPIAILFDQQRLSNLGSGAVEQLIQRLATPTSPLAQLREKCSDDDLIATIKSRHLQAPCEIQAWAQYMSQNMEKFNAEIAKLAAENQSTDVESQNVE